MTSEILIDGVNVYNCQHYRNQSCVADYLLTDQVFSNAKCANSPNCYFKQLAREKAKNKQEAEEFENLRMLVNEALGEEIAPMFWDDAIRGLKAKNAELEAETKHLKEWRKKATTCQECYEAGLSDGKWKIEQLEAKVKELEEEKAEIKKYLGIGYKSIIQRLEELNEFRDNYRSTIIRQKDTLSQIKKVAENFCLKCKIHYMNSNCYGLCQISLMSKQILELLKEVENV